MAKISYHDFVGYEFVLIPGPDSVFSNVFEKLHTLPLKNENSVLCLLILS